MYGTIVWLKAEAIIAFHLYKSFTLKIRVILFLLKNNYQHRRHIYMYTQQEKQNIRRHCGLEPQSSCRKLESRLRAFKGMTANINLKKLSNDQLLSQTKNLVQKERNINIQVLQHLQEIENLKSRLWAFQGFPQPF